MKEEIKNKITKAELEIKALRKKKNVNVPKNIAYLEGFIQGLKNNE